MTYLTNEIARTKAVIA